MWKFNCFPTTLILFSLINYNAATPAISPKSMRGIIFPTIDWSNDCFVDEERTIMGTCKSLAKCPTAVDRWQNENIHPQTCYFNKFEHVVCCEKQPAPVIEPEVYTPPPRVLRRSEMECEKYYYLKIQVVHGVPTKPKEFPYMAALGWHPNWGNNTQYRCGGVLISKRFVLTAAHCSELSGNLPYVVRLGGVNLTDNTVSDIGIKQIIKHPKYTKFSAYNDIALIELEQDVSEMPACVWSSNDVEHSNVTAIGYGHTQFAGVSSDQLLKAPLFVVANDICGRYFAVGDQQMDLGIQGTQICAGDPEHFRDTCQGDSGGPIIMKVERDALYSYVVGITSLGRGCAGEPPSIYTRTSSYIDWIEDIVWPIQKLDIRNNS